MKRIFTIALAIISCTLLYAQTPKSVLDKTAEMLAAQGGITADFAISNSQSSQTTGTISVKGRMFYIQTPMANVWFDGKTQWTYVKENDEVNVTNPTESELQAINPYNFINIYRKGYKYTMNTKANSYIVRLKAIDKSNPIDEMLITVGKKSYVPTSIMMCKNSKWSTISISNFKKTNHNNSIFKFNKSAYPSAEVIDLR